MKHNSSVPATGRIPFFRSVSFQIPVMLCILTLLPLLLLFQFNYSTITRITLDNMQSAIQNDLSSKALSIDYLLSDVTQFALSQCSDTTLIDLVKTYSHADGGNRRISRSNLTIELGQRIVNSSSIDNIYLIIDESDVIASTIVGNKEITLDSSLGSALYAEYQKHKGMISWSNLTTEDGSFKLLYLRPISVSGCGPCTLVLDVNTEYIQGIITNKLLESSGILIRDFRGNAELHDNLKGTYLEEESILDSRFSDAEIFRSALDSRQRSGSYIVEAPAGKVLVSFYSSLRTFWKYIELTKLEDIYGARSVQTNSLISVLIIGILVSMLGALVISRVVINPINRVLSAMKKTEQGNFLKVPGRKPNNELGLLIENYNSMTQHLEELIEKVYVQELATREAQLLQIQSQLDEHFLYNTLNTIYGVIKQRDSDDAAEMIMMLARFFRTYLSEGHNYIQVSSVVRLVKDYLWIQKVRYGDRLNIFMDVEESVENAYVVKYLFQPVVENAIVHGFESRIGTVDIHVMFHREGENLYFETSDDGLGIPEERLQELRRQIAESTRVTGENFALKSINEQIRLAYGKEYKIHIESTEGKGTRVFFTIPLRWEVPDGE